MPTREVIMRKGEISSVVDIIDEAQAKKMQEIDLGGDKDTHRALWYEATARGIKVSGYTPTNEDKYCLKKMLSEARPNQLRAANQVADDYYKRVIPTLEKWREGLERKLYNQPLIGRPGQRRIIREEIRSVDSSIEKNYRMLDSLRGLDKKLIEFRPVFEDGIIKYEPKNILELKQQHNLARFR